MMSGTTYSQPSREELFKENISININRANIKVKSKACNDDDKYKKTINLNRDLTIA
jgi:hypothetical protein